MLQNLVYLQAQEGERTIFFSCRVSQMYTDPEFVGPPWKADVMVPIHWLEGAGEVKVDERHIDYLMLLGPEPEKRVL